MMTGRRLMAAALTRTAAACGTLSPVDGGSERWSVVMLGMLYNMTRFRPHLQPPAAQACCQQCSASGVLRPKCPNVPKRTVQHHDC